MPLRNRVPEPTTRTRRWRRSSSGLVANGAVDAPRLEPERLERDLAHPDAQLTHLVADRALPIEAAVQEHVAAAARACDLAADCALAQRCRVQVVQLRRGDTRRHASL